MLETNKTVAEAGLIRLVVHVPIDESAERTLSTSKRSITRGCLQAHDSLILDLLYRFTTSDFLTRNNTYLNLHLRPDGYSDPTGSP